MKIPDGKSATQEEITAASAAVKKYLADMEAYTACLDAEVAAVPVEQQTPEVKAMHVKRYNAAVDAMEAHGERLQRAAPRLQGRQEVGAASAATRFARPGNGVRLLCPLPLQIGREGNSSLTTVAPDGAPVLECFKAQRRLESAPRTEDDP